MFKKSYIILEAFADLKATFNKLGFSLKKLRTKPYVYINLSFCRPNFSSLI
jgi:hypothetical protein